MKHFQYVRFIEESVPDEPFKDLIGVQCIFNGRCICRIGRLVDKPATAFEARYLETVADAIEDEVRDTVDRMDPEVLL